MTRVAIVALATALLLAPCISLAAQPKKGATYRGETSDGDAVVMKVAKGGKRVTLSLTCDSGGEAVTIRRMPVSSTGAFSGVARRSGRVILRASGRFVTPRKARGTKSGVVCFSGMGSFAATRS